MPKTHPLPKHWPSALQTRKMHWISRRNLSELRKSMQEKPFLTMRKRKSAKRRTWRRQSRKTKRKPLPPKRRSDRKSFLVCPFFVGHHIDFRDHSGISRLRDDPGTPFTFYHLLPPLDSVDQPAQPYLRMSTRYREDVFRCINQPYMRCLKIAIHADNLGYIIILHSLSPLLIHPRRPKSCAFRS